MGETKARGLGGRGRGKEWVILGQKRLLQFHRHAQIGFHLLVPGPDLALLGFEFENVPAQKRVLHFEKRLGGNQSDEIPGAIDQQDVVVKFLSASGKNRGQHLADSVANPDPDFVFTKVFADRIARKKRKAVAPTEQGTEFMPGTHPNEFAAFEDCKKFDIRLGKGARDLFRLRARFRHLGVTNELREIDSFRLKNALADVRRRRRTAPSFHSLERADVSTTQVLSVFVANALLRLCEHATSLGFI